MRRAILALLAGGASYGYELKQAFERHFGPVWPAINIGQIYATLARLERDGLVHKRETPQSGRPNKQVYELSAAGRRELYHWLDEPSASELLRNEFVMKLLIAGATGVTDSRALIERERQACFQRLRELTEMALDQRDGESPAPGLLVEAVQFHVEADLRWLDRCAERFAPDRTPAKEK